MLCSTQQPVVWGASPSKNTEGSSCGAEFVVMCSSNRVQELCLHVGTVAKCTETCHSAAEEKASISASV